MPKHQISNYAFVGVLEEFDFVLKASFFVVGGYGTTPITSKL
jgi:hypothetical protein